MVNNKKEYNENIYDTNIIWNAIDGFLSIASSKEDSTRALGFTDRHWGNLKDKFTPKNKKVLKGLGLPPESIEKENIKDTYALIRQAEKWKKEMHEKLILQMNFSSIGPVYKGMNTVLKSIQKSLSYEEHLDLLKDYFPQLIRSYWGEQELLLETSFCKEEEEYRIFVKFPEWVGLGLLEVPEVEAYSNHEPGSDDWQDEEKEDLTCHLVEYLEDMKLSHHADKGNILSQLSLELIDNLIERLNFETEMDWGEFICFAYTQDNETSFEPTFKNKFLVGSLILDGREEEASKVRSDSRLADILYKEYGLDEII